jgi:hypothetical protein
MNVQSSQLAPTSSLKYIRKKDGLLEAYFLAYKDHKGHSLTWHLLASMQTMK